ncbi:MAG: polysaccharide pyruvyl transferase family protein [Rhodospirillales bacterium]|nr:polysaccharide pyruvyl transferase family protein [Rhodospirillales bacterium]
MPIKLYWSGGNRNEINFGDSISPLIVELLASRSVTYADIPACDIVSIGSVLGKVSKKAWKRLFTLRFGKIAVWGSGAFSTAHLGPNSLLNLQALRGTYTRDAMGAPLDTPLGDPGLLLNRFDIPSRQKRYRWGIIPHIHNYNSEALKQLCDATPGAQVIDLTQPDLFETMARIRNCDFIISTSLHGLIAADSWGIPNVWLRVRDNFHTSDWKFLDYFSAVNRAETAPITIENIKDQNLISLENKLTNPDMPLINQINTTLERAFKNTGL